MMKRAWAFAVLALVVAACGGGDAGGSDGGEGGGSSGFPVEVAGATVPAFPERIVSLSASHTEMLFAIGAGDRVIATDVFSDHPAAALDTPKIDAFNPSVEGIAGFDPDLVILAFDPGDTVEGLGALGIPAVLFDAPRTLDEAFGQLIDVGVATGLGGPAADLAADLRSQVAEIVEAVPAGSEITYYHELDGELFTVTSATFVGHLYAQLGMTNVADPADEDGYGYPQLSGEYLLEADPDVILLGDTRCCGVTAASVAERPGWDALTAVRTGRVIELDDDVASRWGPRVVEFMATVATAVHGVDVTP